MARIASLCWIAALIAAGVWSSATMSATETVVDSGAAAGYQALLEIDEREGLTADERDRAMAALYDARLRPSLDDPASIEAVDWTWYAQAAHLMAFYRQAPAYLRDARLAMAALETAGIATREQRETFFGVLVAYREFAAARGHLAAHPDLEVEPVPAVAALSARRDGEALTYRVDPDAFRLVPEPIRFSDGARLVVVSHPLCGFSRRAMAFISDEPELAAAIDGNVLWLAPVGTQLHVEVMQAWNREHPSTPVVIPHTRADWPMLHDWSTPSFYLLQDGELVDHFSGWPLDDSHRARFVEMLERAALL